MINLSQTVIFSSDMFIVLKYSLVLNKAIYCTTQITNRLIKYIKLFFNLYEYNESIQFLENPKLALNPYFKSDLLICMIFLIKT